MASHLPGTLLDKQYIKEHGTPPLTFCICLGYDDLIDRPAIGRNLYHQSRLMSRFQEQDCPEISASQNPSSQDRLPCDPKLLYDID